MVLGFLDWQRATLAWKCAGLDASGFGATTATSTMTLGGLLNHLAWVEDHWCWWCLHARDRDPYWRAVDWTAHPDWEFTSAASDSPEKLRERWQTAVDRSRTAVAEALADGGLDGLVQRPPWPDGRRPSVRYVLLHLIEEYARHNGHADLLRESVDGSTGE